MRQHAHATRVRITLTCAAVGRSPLAVGRALRPHRATANGQQSTANPTKTTLVIEDDGVGFDVRRAGAGRHGIRGMRERAAAIGATLRITSSKNGTRVAVSV